MGPSMCLRLITVVSRANGRELRVRWRRAAREVWRLGFVLIACEGGMGKQSRGPFQRGSLSGSLRPP
jgi:hypothetical protein